MIMASLAAFAALWVTLADAQNVSISGNNRCSLRIIVDGFQNDRGFAKIGLCNSRDSFQLSEERAIINTTVRIDAGKAAHIFRNVPFGTYAITVYHDENGNGQLDKGLFGRPVERYGFSNNAREKFSRPEFEKAALTLDRAEMTVRVTVQ